MIYTIKKNRHCSRLIPSLFCKDRIKGDVVFHGDFSYEIERKGDTNKLIGLSDGLHHHNNSIRLGWRFYNGKYQIMTITYAAGKRTISYLCDFETNKKYSFRIIIFKSHYYVEFDNIRKAIARKSSWRYPRFLLKPFFGGKEKAPKQFKFTINIK